MEFATFEFNKKEYVFFLEDKNLKFGYKIKNNICFDISDEEVELMKDVLSKIVISPDKNDHIKCNKVTYNNKKFQMFYDKKTMQKFFYQISNNKYYVPIEEDNKYLMKKFNPLISFIDNYEINDNDEQQLDFENNDYKRVIMSKGKKIVVKIINTIKLLTVVSLLLGAIQIGTMTTSAVFNEIVYMNMKNNEIYSSYLVGNILYDSDDVLTIATESVLNNNNLSDKEKEIIISEFVILEENSEYISIPYIKESLSNLDIKYNTGGIVSNSYTIGGTYNRETDIITINFSNSIDDVLTNNFSKHNLYHEIGHSFSANNMSLIEAINETIICEYMNDYNSNSYSYYDERMCLYSLCEIIGTDSLKKLYFQGSINPLIEELSDLLGNEEKAYELIHNIDLITLTRHKENNEKYKEIKEETYDLISECYSAKYGTDIKEDRIMMAYLINSGFLNNDLTSLSETKINPKGYFSNDYIEKHPNTELVITTKIEGITDEVEIAIPLENLDRTINKSR